MKEKEEQRERERERESKREHLHQKMNVADRIEQKHDQVRKILTQAYLLNGCSRNYSDKRSPTLKCL